MSNKQYRVRYKTKDVDIEVESTDKSYVDSKLEELLRTAPPTTVKKREAAGRRKGGKASQDKKSKTDIVKLVEFIKESDKFPDVDKNILEKSSQLPKILMCVYFAKDCFPNNPYLRTGEIDTITDQLGVRIQITNVSKTITRKLKYFSGDRVRKRGVKIRYKINRAGGQAFKKLLEGKKLDS